MIRELDSIVLRADIPKYGLKAGDIGTVVLVHGKNTGYEVEFVKLDGETVAVTSVQPSQIRAIRSDEIPHARSMEVA